MKQQKNNSTFLKNALKKLSSNLAMEEQNLRYWFIITFSIGILSCFFSQENNRIIVLLISIFLILIQTIILLINTKKAKIVKTLIKFTTMFCFGFFVAFIKCNNTQRSTFKSPAYDITFEGKIENIRLTSKETILTIQPTKSPITDILDGKVRIKLNDGKVEKPLNNGDVVKISTSLIPIRYGNFPNDKSYENYAKFFDIIATGKAKNIEFIKSDNDDRNKNEKKLNIQNYRNSIQERIYEVNKHSKGAGIVIAILTGNNGFIPKEQLNNIRRSGCAHILAISGLHMSIVVAFVFFIFIHIFAIFPQIALRYNTKKLAVIPAILTCLFYLQVANVPISATRSFIMVLIASITLLVDRPKASLNALFITFFIMLVPSPHYLLSPSFQMSFMAVFGLITIYNHNFIGESNLFSRRKTFLTYCTGIFFTSIIATISTMFFEIYHFKQYAWIGLISNIPTIPLTEFLVLPLGFIGMLFNGTFIGDCFYIASGFFANIVCIITDWTANLPYSFLLAKQMSNLQLFIIIFGLIILFLSRSVILKTIGFLSTIIGIIAYLTTQKYILIYNENMKNIIFFENEKYYSVEPIKSEFLQSVYSQNLGVKEILPMTSANKNIVCNGNRKEKNMTCEYYYRGKKYKITQKNKNKIIGIKEK